MANFLVLLFSILSCQQILADQSVVKELLLEVENEVLSADPAIYKQQLNDGLCPELIFREQIRKFIPRLNSTAQNNQFDDPSTARQYFVLLRNQKHPPLTEEFKKATKILKSAGRQRWAANRNCTDVKNCKLAYVPHIKSIITNSEDLEELNYYWAEWRKKMPTELIDAVHVYVDYYQKVGNSSNRKPSAVWHEDYEMWGEVSMAENINLLLESIRPFYQVLHAHIRHALVLKYGEHVVNKTGPIPQHLMEQVAYQAWKKNSVLKNPFPNRKLPNLQADIDGLGFNPFDLVNMSQNYFGHLGFPNLTREYMEAHFVEKATGGSDCKSDLFDFKDIELQYCPKVYYKKLLQLHGDMSKVRYAMARNNLSIGLNFDACPGFGNAIGEAIILSVSNPTHLQKCLGLLPEYNYDDYLNLNRLYRQAIHTLLSLSNYLVHEKLWVDMIDGKVTRDQYKSRYWEIMREDLGVVAPLKTDAHVFDMPYKFYEGITLQYRSTKKLLGEFLGYDIYREICLKIGEFQRNNAYKMLTFCDFDQNPKSGVYLKKMMEMGSSKPWRQVLNVVNANHEWNLSAAAMLEYFDFIINWLWENKFETNIPIGW